MTVYEFLIDILSDGGFELPVQSEIHFDDGTLTTDGKLVGYVNSGVITFSDPVPKVKAFGCFASILKIEPEAPDAAIVTAKPPFISPIRKRWKFEDA